MMDVTRRSFLRGALALTAVTIAPALPVEASVPRIVGDGVHDDWAGLQAAIDGRPFECEGLVMQSPKVIEINGGRFSISKTLTVSGRHREVHFRNCVVITDGDHPLFCFEGVKNCSVENCGLDWGGRWQSPNFPMIRCS